MKTASPPPLSLPNLRFGLDVAAYRQASRRIDASAVQNCNSGEWRPRRSDSRRFLQGAPPRHGAGLPQIRALDRTDEELSDERAEMERDLKLDCPSLRRGDGLWPGYEPVAFDRAEHPPYRKVHKSLARLSRPPASPRIRRDRPSLELRAGAWLRDFQASAVRPGFSVPAHLAELATRSQSDRLIRI